MPLDAPRLDDRTYRDLVEEALNRIPQYCPEWTDFNPSDPGITLVELFAWMTDIVLYRLNRVPDKHYIKFMELIGMRRREPQAARSPVTFWLSRPQPNTVTIPAGTEVATTRTESEPSIVFTTDWEAKILVPELKHVMTSYEPEGQNRRYNMVELRRLSDEGFEIFPSEGEPRTGDALYMGFEQDLSHHLIEIQVQVATAGGAGIDTRNPPYVWEVSNVNTETGQRWAKAELDEDGDGTRGFNTDGRVWIHLPQMHQESHNDKSAFWVRCRLLSPDETEGMTYRVSPRVRHLEVHGAGITVDATNVSEIREEIIGRSDGTPGQRFYLAHTPVAPRQADERLVVHNSDSTEFEWTEVADFSDSGPEDRHYTLDSISGEVRLAPALPQPDGSIFRYGTVPEKNALLFMTRYRFGGGHSGNVGSKSLNVLKSGLPYIGRVANRQAARGGFNAEDMDNLKIRVPGHLRSLGRAVTAEDFEYLALEAAPGDISRAACLQTPDLAPGTVRLLLIPNVPKFQGYIEPASLRLNPDIQERVTAYLDERRLLTTRLEVREPEYRWVSVTVSFHPTKRSSSNSGYVRQMILDRLFAYLNPLIGGDHGQGWPFGRELQTTDLLSLLSDVPGIDFIRRLEMFPVNRTAGGQFETGGSTDRLTIDGDCVIASYRHEVIID